MPNTVPTCGNTSTPVTHQNPTDLAIAIRVGRHMLATYGNVGHGDIYAYAQAHGGLTEALRILLRALGAESQGLPGKTAGERLSSGEAERSGAWSSQEKQVGQRCPAAHLEDPTGCNGPASVTVTDANNAGADVVRDNLSPAPEDAAKTEAVRRSVDRAFPAVAAFLATERGERA